MKTTVASREWWMMRYMRDEMMVRSFAGLAYGMARKRVRFNLHGDSSLDHVHLNIYSPLFLLDTQFAS
jgi:hypothetical protein